jgi:hypothetical protein
MAFDQLKHRRGTAAAWTSANPILGAGEIGYETDTGKFKMGDGVTAWTSITNYFQPGAGGGGVSSVAVAVSGAGLSVSGSPITSSGTITLTVDGDLATIAGLTATTDSFMQAKAGAWAARTIAQVKTDLGLTGTNSGDQTITLTGDVTGSGTGSFAATIGSGVVSLGKMATLAANSIIGNNTGSPATPIALTAAQVRTLLSLVPGTDVQAYDPDLAQIAALADPNADRILFWDDSAGAWTHLTIGSNLSISGTTLNASGGGSGLADGDYGDITVGSSSTTLTIDNGAVTLAKIANIATDRLLGRDTASSGVVEELTVGGGIEFTGSGGIQTSALTGDVTKSAGGTSTTIANNVVSLAKMATMATASFLGRNTAGTGNVEVLSAATAAGLLNSSIAPVFANITSKPTTLSGYGITDAQALDSDLTSWAGVTRASGFDTFAATPSSANLRSLLTDETGTGAAVFATSPAIATPTLTDPTITGTILEDVFTITDGAAFEIDPGNGSIQLITLTASRTPKATNFAAGESITLMVADGTAYTLTWTDATWGGSGVVWVGGSAPTLAATGYTVIALWKVGSATYGKHVGDVA